MTPSQISELNSEPGALRGWTRSPLAGFAHTRSIPAIGDDAPPGARHDVARRVREFAQRCEYADGSEQIALVDPAGLWAPAVVKTLAAASDAPLRRIALDGDAVVSLIGAALPRRDGSKLRVDHASTPRRGAPPGEAALTLACHSDLTATVVGPLSPAEVDELLGAFLRAAGHPAWQCPRLLFLLPPGAAWIARKIDTLAWPASVRVQHEDSALTDATAVWNRVLAVWEALQPVPGSAPSVNATALQRARDCLADMLHVEGMLACAVVDAGSGTVLAREGRDDHPVDIALAAATSAQALRLHRASVRAMGMPGGCVDELTVHAGHRVMLLRTSPAHAELFLLVVFEGAPGGLAATAPRTTRF